MITVYKNIFIRSNSILFENVTDSMIYSSTHTLLCLSIVCLLESNTKKKLLFFSSLLFTIQKDDVSQLSIRYVWQSITFTKCWEWPLPTNDEIKVQPKNCWQMCRHRKLSAPPSIVLMQYQLQLHSISRLALDLLNKLTDQFACIALANENFQLISNSSPMIIQ